MGLDNRQLALLIWLALVVVILLMSRRSRSALHGIAASIASPKVAGPLLGLFAYTALLIALVAGMDLWDWRLTATAVFWVLGPGIALVFVVITSKPADRVLVRAMRRALGLTVLLQFVVGYFVFALPVELILLPVFVGLGMTLAVAESRSEFRSAQTLISMIALVLFLGLLAYAAAHVASEWQTLDKEFALKALVLPSALTIALLPYAYLLLLWSGYDTAFIWINHESSAPAVRRRAKLGLTLGLHVRGHRARRFRLYEAGRITAASSIDEARRVAREFLESETGREREAREAERRLEENAGVRGADADGRRLDQREFQETRGALQWLATMQMGWYQNRGGRYRPELIDLVEPRDLPQDHGIHLTVAADGQSWWAWRRTITGWCFAIGASQPPPDQWLYDGPEPPAGFPGTDPTWGPRFGVDSDNW